MSVIISGEEYGELQERIRMLSDIALSAVALKLNIENGFPPHLHALNRDLGALQQRFGGVVEMVGHAAVALPTVRRDPEHVPKLTDEENLALLELINAVEAVQDWQGTRVGAALDEVDRMFFVRLDDGIDRCLCVVGCSVNRECPIHGDVAQAAEHATDNREVGASSASVTTKVPDPEELARLRRENDTMRKFIAESELDCIYCGLPKADMVKCSSGFPGCGRADDLNV